MGFPLTATAAIVWEACDGDHTPAAMIEELGAVFDAPSDVIARDVQALLDHFTEIGLLEPATGAGV
jgi:hypothetical protein